MQLLQIQLYKYINTNIWFDFCSKLGVKDKANKIKSLDYLRIIFPLLSLVDSEPGLL